ncbi:hypothetical protein [Candidatus Nitrosoglobus terrae]|nr:hypothetical protein [Candidatus Nitrosoglobus terrae]
MKKQTLYRYQQIRNTLFVLISKHAETLAMIVLYLLALAVTIQAES